MAEEKSSSYAGYAAGCIQKQIKKKEFTFFIRDIYLTLKSISFFRKEKIMVKILVTDDSVFQRNIITEILSESGYEYSEAENGLAALDILKSEKPDLILLDLLMPEMDGFHFLEEFNKSGYNIPVIVLTSDIQNTTKKRCMELGAAGFLNKPVEEEEILLLIKELTG
jgi:twitching motility two-component system response regulator PilH